MKPKFVILGLVLPAAILIAGWGLPQLRPMPVGKEANVPVNGFRQVLADWLWLKANLAWERKDPEQVRRLIKLTVWTDPQTPYFWQNSARMLAYDLPAWQCEAHAMAPEIVHRCWRRDAADEALAFLAEGQRWHGSSAVLATEMGGIALYGLSDRPRAGRYYAQAAAQADAPEYAQRLAQLLNGRPMGPGGELAGKLAR